MASIATRDARRSVLGLVGSASTAARSASTAVSRRPDSAAFTAFSSSSFARAEFALARASFASCLASAWFASIPRIVKKSLAAAEKRPSAIDCFPRWSSSPTRCARCTLWPMSGLERASRARRSSDRFSSSTFRSCAFSFSSGGAVSTW
jgi:hypothetical protein